MGNESPERHAKESDHELERTIRGETTSDDRACVLAYLAWAFAARRRSREILALRAYASTQQALAGPPRGVTRRDPAE